MGPHATRFALLAPLVVVPLLFVAVLRSGESPAPFARTAIPDAPFVSSQCTWACHNRGCRHTPVLPSVLTGDDWLFGGTVRALHRLGDSLSPDDSFAGYGAVNVALFCAAWPAVMFALWVAALRTRAKRQALPESRP